MLIILLLQIALPAEPGIEFEVEVLPPLKEAVEQQLEEGGVQVVKGAEGLQTAQ